mmetsp:Transcript_132768/g.234905  ORF Transcript_132768/g.234905 Transcript_132768/m.234905 type:complete len:228 (-) Transcript_132768:149-832(-)
MASRTVVLALAWLACAGHARRVQTADKPADMNALASLLLANNGDAAFNPSAAAPGAVSSRQSAGRSGSVVAIKEPTKKISKKDLRRLRDMLQPYTQTINTMSPRYSLETLPSEIKELIDDQELLDKNGYPVYPYYGFRSEVDPDLWWGDKDYPPSKVLGIGKDVPSIVFGLSSGVALIVGSWCVAQSNLLNILSGSTVNGWLVLGSLLVPYSWGLHVACWIQKQNGK